MTFFRQIVQLILQRRNLGFVIDLGLSVKFHLGRILLVPSVFSRQQLNSEASRLRRQIFHSQKNGPTDFGRFRRLQLKNEALKPSCHKENTSERESFQSLRSLPAQEAESLEGLLNLPFLEDNTKRTGF